MRRLFFGTHALWRASLGHRGLRSILRSNLGQQTGQSAVHTLHADAFEVVAIGIVVLGHVNRFDLSGNCGNIHQ